MTVCVDVSVADVDGAALALDKGQATNGSVQTSALAVASAAAFKRNSSAISAAISWAVFVGDGGEGSKAFVSNDVDRSLMWSACG